MYIFMRSSRGDEIAISKFLMSPSYSLVPEKVMYKRYRQSGIARRPCAGASATGPANGRGGYDLTLTLTGGVVRCQRDQGCPDSRAAMRTKRRRLRNSIVVAISPHPRTGPSCS